MVTMGYNQGIDGILYIYIYTYAWYLGVTGNGDSHTMVVLMGKWGFQQSF